MTQKERDDAARAYGLADQQRYFPEGPGTRRHSRMVLTEAGYQDYTDLKDGVWQAAKELRRRVS